MNTPVITRAERIWPVGTNPSTDRLKNSPSVTKLTDMNEYRKASNFDHPLTSPVALRRNSVGASPATAIRVPFQPQPASAAGAISMNALLRAEPSPHGGSAGGLGPPHLAVDQLIGPDLPLPGVEVHDRRLKNPFLVGAARVERERAADPGRAPALVDMAVQGEQRLEAPDRLAHRRGADRAQRLPAGDVAQVGVERWRVVELGAVRRGVEVEDRVDGSPAWASARSIRRASSGSSASRNVCHGVGLVHPIETIVKSPSSMGWSSSPVSTTRAPARRSSISNTSSLAGQATTRIPVPASLSSAIAIQRSVPSSMTSLKRLSTSSSSACSARYSSSDTRIG